MFNSSVSIAPVNTEDDIVQSDWLHCLERRIIPVLTSGSLVANYIYITLIHLADALIHSDFGQLIKKKKKKNEINTAYASVRPVRKAKWNRQTAGYNGSAAPAPLTCSAVSYCWCTVSFPSCVDSRRRLTCRFSGSIKGPLRASPTATTNPSSLLQFHHFYNNVNQFSGRLNENGPSSPIWCTSSRYHAKKNFAVQD